MDTIENIWRDFDSLTDMNEKNEIQECNHEFTQLDHKHGDEVCLNCGMVLFPKFFEYCEWNNYKQEDGSLSSNSQRADTFVSDNPYDIGGSIPGINKNSFMMKIHYQQTFSHKQKTFWNISEKFQNYCTHLGIHGSVLPIVKDMWHICMESGKLTRASVRNGLIASCLYYACIYKNLPADRQSIIDVAEGTQKGFLKGEKIFIEIMENNIKYKQLGKEKIDIIENDSFIKYCNKLDLPFSTSEICNNAYKLYAEKLESVTPKSAIAGVLFYIVKFKLNLKTPSKTTISKETGVCIPTINKVVAIIQDI